MFAAVGGSKGALKRQQIETWFATVSGQNRAGLKAGHFKGTKKVFWGVTWQAVGTVPREVRMFWAAFRLVNCVELVRRCIPCHKGIDTHNALQDVSDNIKWLL